MTSTVEVVMPDVLAIVMVCTPGVVIACVVVVLTIETGQEVPDPVKVTGTRPGPFMALIVPVE
jgi:hypothetical protein